MLPCLLSYLSSPRTCASSGCPCLGFSSILNLLPVIKGVCSCAISSRANADVHHILDHLLWTGSELQIKAVSLL